MVDIDLKNLFTDEGWTWRCPCGTYRISTIEMRLAKFKPTCPHCNREAIEFYLRHDKLNDEENSV